MSQTLEQFQAYQTRLEQYDQAIALLYWDLQTAACLLYTSDAADEL